MLRVEESECVSLRGMNKCCATSSSSPSDRVACNGSKMAMLGRSRHIHPSALASRSAHKSRHPIHSCEGFASTSTERARDGITEMDSIARTFQRFFESISLVVHLQRISHVILNV